MTFPNYVAGQRLPNSARQLQNVADSAETFANLQVQAPLTMTRSGRIATLGIRLAKLRFAFAQGFALLEMFGDYMVAEALGTGKTTLLAKPYLLRRTPFDKAGTPTPPERLGVTYEYTDAVTREAIRGEGDNEERENQIVIPQYVVGDILFGVRAIFGGTGVRTPDDAPGEPSNVPVNWIDFNIDGREWAKVPSEAASTAQSFSEPSAPLPLGGILTPPVTAAPLPGPFSPIDPTLRVQRPVITLVGVTQAVSSRNHTRGLDIAKPAGVIAGDVMVAYFAGIPFEHRGPDHPVGWTFVRRDTARGDGQWYGDLYYRVADMSEPPLYTFPVAFTQGATLGILAYRGVDPINPVDVEAGRETRVQTTPSITTTADNEMIVTFFGIDQQEPPEGSDDRHITPADGYIERYEAHAADNFSMGADRLQEVAGPTGEVHATSSHRTVGTSAILALRRART